MEEILAVLQRSNDADQRKVAEARLREIQEKDANGFLETVWGIVSSRQNSVADRFFGATVLMEFVDNRWRGLVEKAKQFAFAERLAGLLVTEPLSSLLLVRKLSQTVALMVRRSSSPKSSGSAALPEPMNTVVGCYLDALGRSIMSSAAPAAVPRDQVLLCLHLLLKEAQVKQVGKLFNKLCDQMSPFYLNLLLHFHTSGTAATTDFHGALLVLKGSLRIFGHGLFSDAFVVALLAFAWRLAPHLETAGVVAGGAPGDSSRAHAIRLLEYCDKILERVVSLFPKSLSSLPSAFFIGESPEGGDRSLLLLQSMIINSPVGLVTSEKLACRAMRIFTLLFAAEEGDEFIGNFLRAFSMSPLLSAILGTIIPQLLADGTDDSLLDEWNRQPEKYLSELDIDFDDEASPSGCAEQLLLALTGSPACAASSLSVAWPLVHQCLAGGEVGRVTAALHAIGICYHTMSYGEDPRNYLQFLHEKLLPLLHSACSETAGGAIAQTQSGGNIQQLRVSPFVVRRVVWLIGMWCGSVTSVDMRKGVHVALEKLWRYMSEIDNTVLFMAALRSVSFFVSDDSFTLEELPNGYIESLLICMQRRLPQLHQPYLVKELSQLVYVMVEKGALPTGGEALIHLFAPALQRSLELAAEPDRASRGSVDSSAEPSDESQVMTALPAILECLCSSVRITGDDGTIWSLWPLIVQCTTPEMAATSWAEDEAWELLLTMVRSTHTWSQPQFFLGEVVPWCLRHLSRDFEALKTVVQLLYSLIVLGHEHFAQMGFTIDECERWAEQLVLSAASSPELSQSYFAVLSAAVHVSVASVAAELVGRVLSQYICTTADIQSEDYAIHVAALAAQCLKKAAGSQTVVSVPPAMVSQLAERLVLVIDVSPSLLVSRWIVEGLQVWASSGPAGMTPDDLRMIELAQLSVAADVAAPDESEGEGHEPREPLEMLLELMGDEGLTTATPHVARLAKIFG